MVFTGVFAAGLEQVFVYGKGQVWHGEPLFYTGYVYKYTVYGEKVKPTSAFFLQNDSTKKAGLFVQDQLYQHHFFNTLAIFPPFSQYNLLERRQMAGTLYLGSNIEQLADRLAADILQQRDPDPFQAPCVLVPNSNLKRWLQLRISQQCGVAMHLGFRFLEPGLWELLGTAADEPERMLDDGLLRLLLAKVLLDSQDNFLEPLRSYLHTNKKGINYRRLWQLAARLARYFREYAYHRPDMIRDWLARPPQGKPTVATAQQAAYRALFAEQGLLSTMQFPEQAQPATLEERFRALKNSTGQLPAIHVFGFSHLPPLHLRILQRLGEQTPLAIYQLNPWIGLLPRKQGQANAWIEVEHTLPNQEQSDTLLSRWAKAARTMLHLHQQQEVDGTGTLVWQVANPVPPKNSTALTVLERLQQALIQPSAAGKKMKQDESLRICACPGSFREAEMVRDSIIEHMEQDKDLKLTDIAVLVTDMGTYRPALESAFALRPAALPHTLSDGSATGESLYLQAFLELLDLASQTPTRLRLFSLLFNPCVQARASIARDDVLVWLEWAHHLHFFRGFGTRQDPEPHSLAHALARLRLGRIMGQVVEDEPDQVQPAYHNLPPHSDLHSSDEAQLEACQLLLERLATSLQALSTPGGMEAAAWAARLSELADEFLGLPRTRPQEGLARRALLDVLDRLSLLDTMEAQAAPARPLAFVQGYLSDQLEALGAGRGNYLFHGITVSSLLPMRPIPFRLVYVMGLGEGNFPGRDLFSSLDLRAQDKQSQDLDIGLADTNRFLFVETLLAVREKLCLSYVCRDLEQDRSYHPCSLVLELEEYLDQQLLEKPFQRCALPLADHSTKYLDPQQSGQAFPRSYAPLGQALRIHDLVKAGMTLTPKQNKELKQIIASHQDVGATPTTTPQATRQRPLTISSLKKFIQNPFEAVLKRSLGLGEEDAPEIALEEEQPLASGFPTDYRIPVTLMQRTITEYEHTGRWQAPHTLLPASYTDLVLQGATPPPHFRRQDQAKLRKTMQKLPLTKIQTLLQEPDLGPFQGAIAVGPDQNPVRPEHRFPAIKLDLKGTAILIQGGLPLVWFGQQQITALDITNGKSAKAHHVLRPLLFYLLIMAAQDHPLHSRVQGKRFRILLATTDHNLNQCLCHTDHTTARTYCSNLLSDYCFQAQLEYLPLDLVFQVEPNPDRLEENADQQTREHYAEQLTAQWDDLKVKEEAGQKEAGVLEQLVQPSLPADPWAVVLRRLTPLFRDFQTTKLWEKYNG